MAFKKSLWGQLPSADNIRTPFTILREQASLLSEITKGLLIGEAKRLEHDPAFDELFQDAFRVKLRIVAPALNNYVYSLIEISYPIRQLYPVTVKGLALKGFERKCQTEEEFEEVLGEILSSQEVMKIIGTLLSQIHAEMRN